MHHVAVALDEKLIGDGHAADLGDAADIVAPEIEQHQMLGTLLRIGEQFLFQRLVLVRRRAAVARAGDRADGHHIAAHFDQNLRARSGDGEAAEVEEVEIRRGIGPPQRAIERERRQRERRLEALRQHDLEGIAGGDVVLGLSDHRFVFVRRGVGFRRHVERAFIVFRERHIQRPVEAFHDAGQPLDRARERRFGVDALVRPHRRDHRN